MIFHVTQNFTQVLLSDVEIFEPFPMLSVTRSTHTTYLDTTGRPVIVLTKDHITDYHTNTIYVCPLFHAQPTAITNFIYLSLQVSYKVPFAAHLKKPTSVGTAMFGVFLLALLARRVDTRLQKRPNK